MRVFMVMCVVAACGGGGARGPQALQSRAATSHSTLPPRDLTPRDMLRAFPAESQMLFAVDIDKLRHSSVAARGWELLREVPQVNEWFESSCGLLSDFKYVLASLDSSEGRVVWAWMRGVERATKVTCVKAKEQATKREEKAVSRGDYDLVTSNETVMELLWPDPQTALMLYQPKDSRPVGEERMRRAIEMGGGFANNAELGALFDHVDFDAGLVFVIDGGITQQPAVKGMTVAIEADDGLRAQIYLLLDTEDRANDLQSQYRTLLQQLESGHLIDSGEARASGRGLAASVSLTGAQFDWWIRFAIARHNDPNATPPPPPAVSPPS